MLPERYTWGEGTTVPLLTHFPQTPVSANPSLVCFMAVFIITIPMWCLGLSYITNSCLCKRRGGFNQSLCPQVNWESEKRSPYHNTARNTLAVKIPNVVNPPHKGPPWTIGATLFWTLRGRVFWEPKKAPGGGGYLRPPPLPEMGGEDGGSDHCPSSVAPKFWEDSFLDPKNFLRRFAPIVEKSTWDGFPWPKKTA